MSYSVHNYIWDYLERWSADELPVYIADDNWAEVNEKCRQCLEENLTYEVLFGAEDYDPNALY